VDCLISKICIVYDSSFINISYVKRFEIEQVGGTPVPIHLYRPLNHVDIWKMSMIPGHYIDDVAIVSRGIGKSRTTS
jgi:hypothetical protein